MTNAGLVQRLAAPGSPTTDEARDEPADRGGVGAPLRRPMDASRSRFWRTYSVGSNLRVEEGTHGLPKTGRVEGPCGDQKEQLRN